MAIGPDRLAGAAQRGDIIVGNAAQLLRRLPVGVDGQALVTDGIDVFWGDALTSIPNQTWGDIIFFDGTAWVVLPAGTVGFVLMTNGPGADPEWVDPALL